MTRKQIRKTAYKSIFKGGETHQLCFDSLKGENEKNLDLLAKEVSRIPSQAKHENVKILRYVYIIALLIVLVLRLVGITVITQDSDLGPGITILMLLIGLLLPVYGVYGALFGRAESYMPVSLLLVVSTLRGLANQQFEMGLETLIGLAPLVVVVILGLIIPGQLKTAFKKKSVSALDKTGLCVYVFEEFKIEEEDLLDSNV